MSGTDNYDDTAKGGYSYAEKLEQVALGNMAPEEIGMASAEEAQIKLVPDSEKKPRLATTLIFRAGSVPIELRLLWAEQEFKKSRNIISADSAGFDKEAWLKENENIFNVQGDLCCGQARARFGQTFKDPIIGLAMMLRIAADKLEAKYAEETAEATQTPDAPQQNETLQIEQS